jgi:hypothetical protein
VAEFLLDTEAASRLMRAERSVVANMRRSGARTVSISNVPFILNDRGTS